MEAIFDEIEKEAAAYFRKEEHEKARLAKMWMMRNYNALKDDLSYANQAKDKARASAARKALKLFRITNNLKA